MNSKERLLAAIEGRMPDRMPVTTHHVMPYFLDRYMGGMSTDAFFDHFGLDAIRWINPYRADESRGDYLDPFHEEAFLSFQRVFSEQWRIESEDLSGEEYTTTRHRFVTPGGTLTMMTQSNAYTTWATERLVKEKSDIDLIGTYMTTPCCNVAAVNAQVEEYAQRGIVRGFVPTFDVFGQPGCWQDAACLVGIERLIMATYDDPEWVHSLLGILRDHKIRYLDTTRGARFDILELGGGDASSTVISPRLFDEFVAPYDAAIIEAAHRAGQRVVYHTCGGMMPLLERIADMGPDAMETFTPPTMGGDSDLAEAKRRVGDRVCMIGGWDQYHYFSGCTEEETRAEVRRCFDAAGAGGGYILCPSDHFFDADPALLMAWADEARQCVYA